MVSLIDDTDKLISEQRLDNNLSTITAHLTCNPTPTILPALSLNPPTIGIG